jgi:imidazolonepropionase-like amidohydrolase
MTRTSRRLGAAAALIVAAGAALGVYVRVGFGPQLQTATLVRAEPATPILFRDVAVFIGTEETARPHQDVLVRDHRIAALAPTGSIPSEGARLVDGRGKTLLPGYIDAHSHIIGSGAPPWAPYRLDDAHNLEAYLYSGVTTVYGLGGLAPKLRTLRDRVRSGELPGPDLYFTHLPITARGGHPLVVGKELLPWPLGRLAAGVFPQPRGPAEAEQAVRDTVRQGVDFIKLTLDRLPPSAPELDEATVRAVIAAAHRHNRLVFVHIGTYEDARLAAAAGADVLAHGVYRGRLSEAQARALAGYHIPLSFTLAGWQVTAEIAQGRFQPSALDEASCPPPILDALRGESGKRFAETPKLGEFAAAVVQNQDNWEHNLRLLHAAGVPLLIGTDTPLPGIFPGSSFHHELQRSQRAGIPAAALLRAATSTAARMLHLDRGEVAVGKRADLVLVVGDPLADVTAAAAIELVVADGQPLRRL